MGIDISKLTSAVNKYLYSISDVNKLVNGDSQTDGTSAYTGLFEKILTGALSRKTSNTSSDTVANNNAVAKLSLDIDTDTLNSLGLTKDLVSDNEVADALISLYGLTTGNSSSVSSSLSTDDTSLDALVNLSLPDLTGTSTSSTANSGKTSSAGANKIGSVSRDALAERINSAFQDLDIEGQIKASIASHNRLSEISDYNAQRLSAYKTSKSSNASVDLRL